MVKIGSVLFILALVLSLVSCGEKKSDVASAGVSDGSAGFKVIGISTQTSDGRLGPDAVSAIAAADTICAADFGPGFKALLMSSERHTSKDWVLRANTEYRREDNTTVVATTNAQSIFKFPLINSITVTNTNAWTGIEEEWEIRAGFNCENWTDNTDGIIYGGTGATSATSDSVLEAGMNQCKNPHLLFCVEQ